MSKKIEITLDFNEDLTEYLKKEYSQLLDYRILSQSLDARGAPRGKTPKHHYRLELVFEGEKFDFFEEDCPNLGDFKVKPIIVGAGPAGLFCALRFMEYGVSSVIIERGDQAYNRMKSIASFWRYGKLNEENNVCFGEGGAGLFSDGKLITRVKSSFVKYVMQKFVDFGAPKEAAYISNPHIGSNKIRKLISKISDFLIHKKCEIFYNTRVDELLFKDNKVIGVLLSSGRKLYSPYVILSTGHSAKNIYYDLKKKNVQMQCKDFAVGARLEHSRELIDQIQFGKFASSLSPARYRLAWENRAQDKGTYSFVCAQEAMF